MGTKSVESELNREKVYKYIKANPKTTIDKIAKEFGFTKSQTDYYVRNMVLAGVVNKVTTQTANGRLNTLSAGRKAYVRKVKTEEEKVDEELKKHYAKLPQELQGVARIVKLSNRNMQPMYQKGKKRKFESRGIGSSMGLFDGY